MNEIPSVENYQYLWDGSQPGWVLQCLSGHYVDLSLTFSSAGPSNGELMAVRRTVPEYTSLPLNEVLAKLRGCNSIPLGRFLSDQARKIAARCSREGLCVLETVIKAPRYLPTNEVSQTVLLIEDDALAKEVCALALQHGVPVRHVSFSISMADFERWRKPIISGGKVCFGSVSALRDILLFCDAATGYAESNGRDRPRLCNNVNKIPERKIDFQSECYPASWDPTGSPYQ